MYKAKLLITSSDWWSGEEEELSDHDHCHGQVSATGEQEQVRTVR